MRRALAVVVAPVALALALAGPADARARFDTQLLALIPTPGFPALAYVHPNGRIYEGTYDNPSGDTVPSRVLEYTGEGTLLRSWTVSGQDLSHAHGVQVANSDPRGRLVLLDKSPARALLLDTRTGEQTTYATFADLPNGGTPMPDYAAWGPDGSLYVTDYQQAVLWRVPPGGGAAQPWLTDPRLDGGGEFGTAGLELMADRRTLLISQASSAGFGEPNPTTGKLYKVPIQPDGRPGPMTKLWESRPTEAPDGFAIAKSGRVYLALVSPVANQLVVIGPDGKELERYGGNGSPVPFDAPSSVNFLGTRAIVANQAFVTGDTTHMAILDVETGEEGLAPYIPPAPAASTKAKPKAKKKKAKRKHRKKKRRRRRRHH